MSQNSTVPDFCDLDETEDVDISNVEQKLGLSDPIAIVSPRKSSLSNDQARIYKRALLF